MSRANLEFNHAAVSLFCTKKDVSRLILLVNISAVSAIFTFRLILPFNALALSTNDLVITIESALIFDLI